MYQPPLRKSYYRPKSEQLEFLYRAYTSGADIIQFGTSILGMSRRTAQRYALKVMDPTFSFKPRGGPRHTKVTPPIHDFMVRLVSENNEITLEEVRDRTLQRFPYLGKLAISTVWKHLDCQLITSKSLRYVSAEANTQENLQKRVEYVNFISTLDPTIHRVYVDETNFTILTRRSTGWSPTGERATRSTVINGCKKINIIHSVSPEYGNIYTFSTNENINGETFDQYIRDMLGKLQTSYPDEKFIIIMDNCRTHRVPSLQQIFDEEQFKNNFQFRMLPPYSPFLNPIERVFSQIKNEVRMYLSQHNQELIATASLPWGQKGAARYSILEKALNESINMVTPQNVSQYALRTTSYYAQVLQMQPIME